MSVISSLISTFLADAFSLDGELRHTFAKCPAFPHDRHLLVRSCFQSLDLCPVLPHLKHFPWSCWVFGLGDLLLLLWLFNLDWCGFFWCNEQTINDLFVEPCPFYCFIVYLFDIFSCVDCIYDHQSFDAYLDIVTFFGVFVDGFV